MVHFSRPNIRLASAFRNGRVFIVGGSSKTFAFFSGTKFAVIDAAHTHTPAGGQGMNSSMLDSVRLHAIGAA